MQGGCLCPCLPLPEPEAGRGGRALSWGCWGAAGRTVSLSAPSSPAPVPLPPRRCNGAGSLGGLGGRGDNGKFLKQCPEQTTLPGGCLAAAAPHELPESRGCSRPPCCLHTLFCRFSWDAPGSTNFVPRRTVPGRLLPLPSPCTALPRSVMPNGGRMGARPAWPLCAWRAGEGEEGRERMGLQPCWGQGFAPVCVGHGGS